MSSEIFWFLLALVLFGVEFFAPGLFFVFLGCGAITAFLADLIFGFGFATNLIIGLLGANVSFFVLKKQIKKLYEKVTTKLDDDFVGKKLTATQDVEEGEIVKFEVNGTDWSCLAANKINKGDTIMIIEQNNLTLKITNINNLE